MRICPCNSAPSGQVYESRANKRAEDPASLSRHLHAHALAGPIDPRAPGSTFYRRNVVFGALNGWDLEDLRAEIRCVGHFAIRSAIRWATAQSLAEKTRPITVSSLGTRIELRLSTRYLMPALLQ